MFSQGIDDSVLEAREKISDLDIASYYLGIFRLPIRICSPLREDKKPSFGLYTRDGMHIFWIDFATGEKGSLMELIQKMWGLKYWDCWSRISKELSVSGVVKIKTTIANSRVLILSNNKSIIETKSREWEQYDLDYWKEYGVTKEWLDFANVHPISYIIFIKEPLGLILLRDNP